MKTKKYCCICGKEITDWGNNPWGALDDTGEIIKWKDTDVCCSDCNTRHVIPGRIYTIMKDKEKK